MEGQQRAVALLGGRVSGQGLQLFVNTAIAGTKDGRIGLVSSSREDLNYMGTKPTSTGSCFLNLEEIEKA